MALPNEECRGSNTSSSTNDSLRPVNSDSSSTGDSESLIVQTGKRIKVYPENPNRVRAKKPKSRGGCKTCKIRRVKCGEERPCCLRCVKFQVQCDGYPTDKPQVKRQQVLLPKRYSDQIRGVSEEVLFQSANEYQYFLFFRDDIALDLSGAVPDKLWNFVVLRSSVEEPALRYLSVAISALRKSQAHPDAPDALTHHRFAVSQYARALKRIQIVLDTFRQEDAIRISLTASLLIFCFENTLGELDQAVAHMKSALVLMRKRLPRTTKPYMQSRSGPLIADLEEEVLDAFIRMDNTIIARVGDPHNEPKISRLQIKYSDDFELPARFQGVLEAKRYLDHLQFRAMPFLAHMPDYLATGRAYDPYIPRDAFEELATQLDEFADVFEPTLTGASMELDFRHFAAAAVIRVNFLVTRIAILRVAYGNDPIPPNEFVKQSQEIVDLSGKMTRDKSFRKTFVMDCGIIPALFVVLLICPRRDIKEEAIRILQSAAGRIEVVWDAAAIAEMGKQILCAEDQYIMASALRDTITIADD